MTRCEACTQLTQESDFVEVEDTQGQLLLICGWCAYEMERAKVAQTVIHDDEEELF